MRKSCNPKLSPYVKSKFSPMSIKQPLFIFILCSLVMLIYQNINIRLTLLAFSHINIDSFRLYSPMTLFIALVLFVMDGLGCLRMFNLFTGFIKPDLTKRLYKLWLIYITINTIFIGYDLFNHGGFNNVFRLANGINPQLEYSLSFIVLLSLWICRILIMNILTISGENLLISITMRRYLENSKGELKAQRAIIKESEPKTASNPQILLQRKVPAYCRTIHNRDLVS